MQRKLKSLFKTICEDKLSCYSSAEEAKRAKLRNKQISKTLKQHQKEELKKLKILLLGKNKLHLYIIYIIFFIFFLSLNYDKLKLMLFLICYRYC